jgi:hypothetical protein
METYHERVQGGSSELMGALFGSHQDGRVLKKHRPPEPTRPGKAPPEAPRKTPHVPPRLPTPRDPPPTTPEGPPQEPKNPPEPKALPLNLQAAFRFFADVLRQSEVRKARKTG